jgi:hypothetical protein
MTDVGQHAVDLSVLLGLKKKVLVAMGHMGRFLH